MNAALYYYRASFLHLRVEDEIWDADVIVAAVPLDEREVRVLVAVPTPHDGAEEVTSPPP